MSIYLVTGSLGGGKTTYAVEMMRRALGAGKVVATNIDVVEDFPQRVGATLSLIHI